MSNPDCFGVLPEYWHSERKMNHQEEELPLPAKQESVALVRRFCSNLRRWCWSCIARYEGELGLNENTCPQMTEMLLRIN